MIKEYLFLGFGLEVIGVLILIMVAISGGWHGKYNMPFWKKRYWWLGWRPIFKVYPPNEKPRWMIKLNHKVVRYGWIPPKHKWNWVAFLFILTGIFFQILTTIN